MWGMARFLSWGQATFEGGGFYVFGFAVLAVMFFFGWLIDRPKGQADAPDPPSEAPSASRVSPPTVPTIEHDPREFSQRRAI